MSDLKTWQRKYLIGAALIAPIAPFLLLQGQITRWKVGLLPAAEGELTGTVGPDRDPVKLLTIGESTVAGLGARRHEYALAGQFASHLSSKIRQPVEWHVLGKNGVTARDTIEHLVPRIPPLEFDYVLIGLGGNDVMRLTSPRMWRGDMLELIGVLRNKFPSSVIFLSNCPMIILSPVLPEPIKSILWTLSRMHDANAREFTGELDRVFYYPQPVDVKLEGFFADGIHPSEQGYADWSAAMMQYFIQNYQW